MRHFLGLSAVAQPRCSAEQEPAVPPGAGGKWELALAGSAGWSLVGHSRGFVLRPKSQSAQFHITSLTAVENVKNI